MIRDMDDGINAAVTRKHFDSPAGEALSWLPLANAGRNWSG
jgi:hypothetical protein